MIELLQSIAAFLFAIGLLVAIHEFGHFWVARRLGVAVIRFSVGFGRPLWRRVGKDGVEYVIAALPLGGYVKMVDEREGEVSEELRPQAFNRQPLSTRFAVVAAGPAANFLFAIAAYWLVFVIGVMTLRPVVGTVDPDSIAALAGVRDGDELLMINQQPTRSWDEVLTRMLDGALEGNVIELQVRSDDGVLRLRQLDIGDKPLLEETDLLATIGITPYRLQLEPVIDQVTEGGAADRAGLRHGDRLLSVDGLSVTSWSEWRSETRRRPDRLMVVEVARDNEIIVLELTPERSVDDGEEIGLIGATPLIDRELIEAMRHEVRHGPIDALGEAAAKTWSMSLLTLRILGRIVIGEASLENVSGPISIAHFAGQFAQAGLISFLGFLALISLSLGVINLLPIPILDGGHLMYYLIELVTRREPSEMVLEAGQRIGVVLIGLLMAVALYNDFQRLFG
jgi:regulator of sigma E protease